MIEQSVTLSRAGAGAMDGYFVQASDEASPAVLVIHEIWGMNDQIRSVAQRFAGEGYAALAVDLFSHSNRALCLLKTMSSVMRNPLDNPGVRDLRAAIDWLQGQPGVDANRVGVIGFCLGGGYALSLACVDGDVKAVSAFYGMMPNPEAFKDACAVAGSYGGRDPEMGWVAPKLERALARFNVPHDVKVYPKAMHSFFNDQSRFYDADASADSWKRTLAFFGEQLGTSHER